MSSNWFVVRGGEERGPFSAQRLKEMATAGEIRPQDGVRREDMPSARPASSVKGLFPDAGGIAPVRPPAGKSSDRSATRSPPPGEPQGGGRTRGLILGSVVAACLLLCCGGFGVVGYFVSKARNSAQTEVAEADALWERGDKAGATEKYRRRLGANAAFLKSEDRPRVYGRVIDYEFEHGDATAAKSLLAEAARNGVTPQVGHPEAKTLLAQAGPKGADPVAIADDGEFSNKLTARFLPCVPGNVKTYEQETYAAVTTRSLVYAESRETCGAGGVISIAGTMKSPGQPPTPLTGMRHIRTSGGFVEVGEGNSPSHWARIIKLGAKLGDEWPDNRIEGTFKLVRFDRETAHGAKGPYDLVRAVIEHRSGGNGAGTGFLTETTLEWDGGVQSEKRYILSNGQKRLVGHKRLVSSTSE
ncbi:DUF4339 domain-containing protein [bacterium]|nr:DUF4339 domain-containing protein [bacterium]